MEKRTDSHARGFTMVELLVVVAIIIALAALSFVGASKASRAAKSAATVSNLREIGVAVGGWMTDNGNFFPPCWNNTDGANKSYAQTLDPYMHGVDNFRNVDSKFIGPNKRMEVEVNAYSHPITYSMNRAVCRDTTAYGSVSESLVHVTQVERPDDVIIMADGCQNPRNLNQANASAYRVFSSTGATGAHGQYDQAIAIGPDIDTPAGDGWFRYADGKCHALTCAGAAKVFKKGTIKKRNVWIDLER